MLDWASQFSILLFLDNNAYPAAYGSYECLMAVSADAAAKRNGIDTLNDVAAQHAKEKDWLFGHIAYDYKNRLEHRLSSAHTVKTGFPDLFFFIPDTVCHINLQQTALTIETIHDAAEIYRQICSYPSPAAVPLPALQFTKAVDKEQYIATIEKLRQHIANGDCYEINYCTKGYCENAMVDPLSVFRSLNGLSPAPFAAYYRLDDKYMICASPERYIRKEGQKIISQPIKGTARRGKDEAADEAIKEQLRNDVKERAENVMIADLVRNDLARCCETGTVAAEELFGVYTFPQVHQLISTITGTLKAGLPITDAIKYSYPMGSMTGAPKYKVMQLIEQYEDSRRELFSGTVGYITPGGDFDFNVVIRSLFYNADTRRLSYQTGGAITYDSDAEQEWEEMRLKAWALERIFA